MLPAELDEHVHAGLLTLARRTSASLFVVLQAAFAACLAEFAGTGDVTLATSLANRTDPMLDDVVGNFADDVVMRVTTDPGALFETVVATTRQAAIGAYDHPDVPNDRLAHVLDPDHPDGDPLFQVTLILQRAPPKRPPWTCPG